MGIRTVCGGCAACEVCGKVAVVVVSDVVGVAVSVCARCRRRYFPTREECAQDDARAERKAERECERMAEDQLCGFEF